MSQLLFRERLQKAAEYAGVEFTATAIGRSLGVKKQTADKWLDKSEPRNAMLFHIADTWHVDARWLATGDGHMTPPPGGHGLSTHEMEMVKSYRKAAAGQRPSIIAIVKSFAKMASIALLAGVLGFNNNSIAGNLSAPQSAKYLAGIHIVRRWFYRAFLTVVRKCQGASREAFFA